VCRPPRTLPCGELISGLGYLSTVPVRVRVAPLVSTVWGRYGTSSGYRPNLMESRPCRRSRHIWTSVVTDSPL
jgi:hypothetical protein